MKSLDGDEKLEYLRNKILNSQHLSDEDVVSLTFIPLMRSKENKTTITIQCIELADKIRNQEEKTKCTTLLYALFEKFGDEVSKKKFMEVISMTEVGKMIFEDGKNEGKAEGKTEGKAEMLIKQLNKKFNHLPEEYVDKIKLISEEVIETIATDIFDIDKVEELEKYFKNK